MSLIQLFLGALVTAFALGYLLGHALGVNGRRRD